jgi:formylmethanofuran dehydrogenase subunit B
MQTLTQVACTVCGCVCDDLTVTVSDNRITSVTPYCPLAETWFLKQNTQNVSSAMIDGEEAPFEAALGRASAILAKSKALLIYGLSRSTTEGQRAAIALAEKLGGSIDTTAATGHAPSLMALQQVGESTCSLGEVKNRADLVIYWRSNPIKTHPRHMERYAVDPRGMFVPNGKADRHVVVIDGQPTESSQHADRFIPVDPDADWEMLWTLRGLVAGIIRDAPESWQELADWMKRCRFGIIFFGGDLARDHLGHRNIEALLQLVTDLNAYTRFYARRMRRFGDVAGADSVLTWQTGDPFGVQFGRGYPRYNPGEFSAPALLERGEIDCCLFVGSETSEQFPAQALEHLRRIPTISLDNPGTEPPVPATVRFTTAVYGVHRKGTAYRMDEVPIPLKELLTTEYPSDGEVLTALLQRLATN